MKLFDYPRERERLERFFSRSRETAPQVERAVDRIIAEVRREGDRAVARLTQRFDSVKLRPAQFEIPRAELERSWAATPARLRSALRTAARRITAFHRRQRLEGWSYRDPELGRIEMRVTPVERAGVYAPGGKAAYPSTVLMNVIPAKVAGVGEVVVATPPGPEGNPAQIVLAAAHLAGADRVFRIGGAQGVAAMAHGTATIPRVDKLVGPGNVYVATAKRRLFGQVDIESVAGPTEVLILADGSARLDWIAADLLAQAEHDEQACAGAILIGGSEARARRLEGEVKSRLEALGRGAIAAESMRRNGYIILARTESAAVEIANRKAPEHVQIMTRRPRALAKKIRHAGAIFIGAYTPEAVGDYIAGPNHTLPTGGTARFFSPLSVWSFYKTLHTVEATRGGLARFAGAIESLAEAEGLDAHVESVRVRFQPEKKG